MVDPRGFNLSTKSNEAHRFTSTHDAREGMRSLVRYARQCETVAIKETGGRVAHYCYGNLESHICAC